MTDIFKRIVDAGMIEFWARETLRDWFDVYTQELEIQRAAMGMPDQRGSHPLPKSYLVVDTLDREVADQLPSIVIVSPGLTGERPLKQGDGRYRAAFLMGIGIFASANTREATKDLVRFYAAVVRSILIQKPSLGGNAFSTVWVDESFDDDFGFEDQQTISAGQVIFHVTVDDVVTFGAGPVTDPDPDEQPGSLNHRANVVIIDLRKESLRS